MSGAQARDSSKTGGASAFLRRFLHALTLPGALSSLAQRLPAYAPPEFEPLPPMKQAMASDWVNVGNSLRSALDQVGDQFDKA